MDCNEVDGNHNNNKIGDAEVAQPYTDVTERFFHPVAGN